MMFFFYRSQVLKRVLKVEGAFYDNLIDFNTVASVLVLNQWFVSPTGCFGLIRIYMLRKKSRIQNRLWKNVGIGFSLKLHI